jgi:hypothetical protein
LCAARGNQRRTEAFDKAAIGANGESALQPRDIWLQPAWPQQRARFVHGRAGAFTQRFGARREHHAPAGAHQQRVARRFTQARERAAHGRWAQAQAARGARHAGLKQQSVQRNQQVQVGLSHCAIVAPAG